MSHLLRTNPGPLSVLLLVAGFAFIIVIGSPLAHGIGVVLTLLAFLVPFFRLSILPMPGYEIAATERVQAAQPRRAGPEGPRSVQTP